MNLLVLSPHRDDAAFSLSLSIEGWLAVGHRVTVLNVFTRSLYAPFSDAETVQENDRLGYVSAMRRKEDESFLKRMPGLAMLDLNLKDAPIRLRCDLEMVCSINADPTDTAIPKIRKAIKAQIESSRPVDGLVLPLALGRHVDHCVTRDAARTFSTELPSAFYEDLPYASREGAQAELTQFRSDFGTRLYPVSVRSTSNAPVAFKSRIAGLYASQIDIQLAESIAQFSERYDGSERLWANDLWVSKANANKLSIDQHDEQATPLP